ncbi:MAG: hypothetical protein HON47_02715 [Candidatus Diapherotrites archaeon]|jgi:hypothetical protein|uniref:Uncharacterized protein n=1 Tax=Candidatus Iainarchaeum sp. TaxID=3101447 RepID=A0A8T5GF54_9ARCH|nr:hypothetical protein [Candidatus Diapherotrites archaeon]MBT7241560.1 hypothetical protein [Candidatus Diapherotrites archaeon]
MKRNLVIVVIVIIIILFILASISPMTDYNSGTACPYRTIRSDCLGIKFPSSALTLGGPSQVSCLGLISNTKCYINECPSSSKIRYEIPCDSVKGDFREVCMNNIDAFSQDTNSKYHCCNLVRNLCD